MKPQIIKREDHHLSRDGISAEALKVLYRLKKCGYLGYLCGGGVRDLLLHRKPKDFDIATDATPRQVKRAFKNCRLIGRRFRLAHVIFGNDIIEVATFRSNEDPSEDEETGHMMRNEDGVILRDNVFGTPEQDAQRRDFTINAMYYNIADFTIIDHVGGLKDIQKKLIRIIGDPTERYIEDPVRMIRAVRFSAQLDFKIERKTRKAILVCREYLAKASHARMYEECLKLFMCGNAVEVFNMLRSFGLLGVMFPNLTPGLTEAAKKEINHITSLLAQIDQRKAKGAPVSPALLYCCLLGRFILQMSDNETVDGVDPSTAIYTAANQVFAEMADRILIPKQIGYQIKHILASQYRFKSTRGKKPYRFIERHYFPDALAWYLWNARISGTEDELTKWWGNFVKENRHLISDDQAPPRPRRKKTSKRRPGRRGNNRNQKKTD